MLPLARPNSRVESSRFGLIRDRQDDDETQVGPVVTRKKGTRDAGGRDRDPFSCQAEAEQDAGRQRKTKERVRRRAGVRNSPVSAEALSFTAPAETAQHGTAQHT